MSFVTDPRETFRLAGRNSQIETFRVIQHRTDNCSLSVQSVCVFPRARTNFTTIEFDRVNVGTVRLVTWSSYTKRYFSSNIIVCENIDLLWKLL